MSAAPTTPSPSQTEPDEPMNHVLSAVPGLRGLLLLDAHGEVYATSGPNAELLAKLASFAVGLIDLSGRLTQEAGCGESDYALFQAPEGAVVIHRVGPDHLLLALADAEACAGTLAHDLGWCVEQIEGLV